MNEWWQTREGIICYEKQRKEIICYKKKSYNELTYVHPGKIGDLAGGCLGGDKDWKK
jgi:hypothetical protein